MSDFTQSFLGGVAAGQQRKKLQQDQERQQEEFDLKKSILKHQMDKLKIEEKVKAREIALKEAESMKNFSGGMQPSTDPAGKPGSSIPGPPAPDQPVLFRKFNIPAVPEMGLGEMSVNAPTREGDEKSVLDRFNAQESARRALPPTQDQIIDNQRLQMQANDSREAKIQSLQIQMAQAQSAQDMRRLTAEIAKQNLEISRERLQIAKDTAAKQNDPEADRIVALAVLNRKLPYSQVDRFQRANVTKMIAQMGGSIPRDLTTAELQNQQKAESALISTEAVQDILKKSPQTLALAIVPGFVGNALPGVAQLRFHLGEMTDVKTRDRTGAALNQSEIAFYGAQAPKPEDLLNPENIQVKLNHFVGLNLAQTGRPVKLTSPDGKESFLVTDGYDPQQRAEMRRKINAKWTVEPYKFESAQPAAPGPAADPLGILTPVAQ